MKQILLTATFALVSGIYSFAQTDYKMAGPYEVVARDGQYAFTKGGSERDMKAAWDFAKDTLPAAEYDEEGNLLFVETKLYAKWEQN